MDLGKFSVSLAVKDLQASKAFYEKMGFEPDPPRKFDNPEFTESYGKTWLILRNGPAMLGLFQGMFTQNTLTWNPPDVRGLQKRLKVQGVEFKMEADESTTGPAAAMLFDPDGNPILLDQHNS